MKHPAPSRHRGEPITLALIEACVLHLLEAGKTPSQENVRALIGGSPNAIHPMLQRWFAERAPELLAGQVAHVQPSDLPEAVHALVAELREDARRAADAALAGEAERLAEAQEEARSAAEAARQAEAETRRRAAELEATLQALTADLNLARGEVQVAREARRAAEARESEAIEAKTSAEAAASEAREALRRLQAESQAAAERAAAAAERDVATIAMLRAELERRDADLDRADADIERLVAGATAAGEAHRSSIEDMRSAHLREVQAMRATSAESAARWSDARAKLEAESREAKASAAHAESMAEDERRIAQQLRADMAEAERLAAQRIAALEAEVAALAAARNGAAPLAEQIAGLAAEIAALREARPLKS